MRLALSFSRKMLRKTAIAVAVSQAALAITPAFAETATDIQRRMAQRAQVQQAIYQLVAEGSDTDGDGAIEAPAMKASALGPADGGVVPDTSGAPKTDGYDGLLGYCVWDIGTVKSSPGRLVGGDGAGALAVAVISYGLDNTFQTTCAQLAAGLGSQGDDFAFWMTSNQMSANNSTNVSIYWGGPVDTVAVLETISGDILHDGEVRLVKSTNQLFRWGVSTKTWSLVGDGASALNWKDIYENQVMGSFNDNKVAIGQKSLGPDMLTVNGKTEGALGLRGSTPRVGTSIYDAAGTNVKAFLGFDHEASKLVLSSQTGTLSVQLGGDEKMLLRADGSLALNGATVFDAQRNLAANAGTFSSSVSAAGYQISGLTVIDAGRNLVNIDSLSAVGSASVGSLRIAGEDTISSARVAKLTGLQVTGSGSFSGSLNVSGGLVTTGVVSSGPVIGSLSNASAPAFTFNGATQTGLYAPSATALGLTVAGSPVLTATANGVVVPVGMEVSGGSFVLSSPKTSGTLTNRPAAGVANRVYVTTDTDEIFFDTGATWKRISATEVAKLNDMAINGSASGQTLVYNAITGKWANATIGAGAGISVVQGAGTLSIGLTNVGVAGTYGSATQVPVLTTDAQGRVTAVNNVTVTPAWTSITGKPTTVAGYGITDINSYAPTLTGMGASGNWSISVTGNAATATKLATARTISATGDATWSTTFDGSGNSTGVLTLANSGVTAGSYGNVTQVPVFTVDAKGRLTSVANATVTPAWTSITGKPTTVAGYGITDLNDYAPTLTGLGATGDWGISVTGNAATATKLATARTVSATGDASWTTTFDGSGNSTGVLTLSNSGVTAGAYGTATAAPVFSVDAKGRLTSAGVVTITPAWTSITGKPTTVAGYGITDINSYAPTLTGVGASGNWGISVTGNAATATKLATARTISATGDATWSTTFDGSGNSTGVLTLANSGVTAGTYGNVTQVPVFTVDAKGRVTAVANATVTPAWESITGKPTTIAGYGITDPGIVNYAVNMNQNVRTTDLVTFGGLTASGIINANGGIAVNGTTVVSSTGYLKPALAVTSNADCATQGTGALAKGVAGELFVCATYSY